MQIKYVDINYVLMYIDIVGARNRLEIRFRVFSVLAIEYFYIVEFSSHNRLKLSCQDSCTNLSIDYAKKIRPYNNTQSPIQDVYFRLLKNRV